MAYASEIQVGDRVEVCADPYWVHEDGDLGRADISHTANQSGVVTAREWYGLEKHNAYVKFDNEDVASQWVACTCLTKVERTPHFEPGDHVRLTSKAGWHTNQGEFKELMGSEYYDHALATVVDGGADRLATQNVHVAFDDADLGALFVAPECLEKIEDEADEPTEVDLKECNTRQAEAGILLPEQVIVDALLASGSDEREANAFVSYLVGYAQRNGVLA